MADSLIDTREMKYHMHNWRSYSPIKVVNETGLLPCYNCGLVIYKVRERGKQLIPYETIKSEDFSGVGGFPDPTSGIESVCPNCKGPLILHSDYIGR